jgi:hypothetical protein
VFADRASGYRASVEHEEQAEEMERDADRMEHDSDRVGEHIDDARKEWEAKEQDPSVPGAQPDEDEDQEPVAGAEEPDSGDDE